MFSSAAEFARYGTNDISNAFWLGTPDGDFIVMRAPDAPDLPDVVHEYTHLMVSRAGLDYPLWLNEGLAEYYSTMSPAGAKIRVGLVPEGALDTLTKGPLIPLDRLFAVDGQSPEYNQPGVAQLFYAQSWALTHMLLSHQDYRDKAPAVLAEIGLGKTGRDALPATYRKPLAAITADLRNYLVRFRLTSSLIDVPGMAHATNATASRPNEVDVEVTLASILGWRPGRAAESRAALVALEARAPNSLRVIEARGLLEIYTRNCGAARVYLTKAVTLGSSNPAILRAYATLVGAADPPRQQALLARAASLAPDTAAAVDAPPIPCSVS